MAVFDAGQGCEKPFFEAALAALQPPAVAVAAAPPAHTTLQPAADIFDLASAAVGVCDALQGLGTVSAAEHAPVILWSQYCSVLSGPSRDVLNPFFFEPFAAIARTVPV